ncbi:MAG: alkaline phosphatase [Polyangiales bacterium]
MRIHRVIVLVALLAGCSSKDDAAAPTSDADVDASTVTDTGSAAVDTGSAAVDTGSVAVDTGTTIDTGPADTGPTAPPKRIVFFLGDGMGITVQTAARIYAVGEDGALAMDALPETGFVRTYSNDSMVTDSAAAMTAYMTGVKGNNDVLSMSPDTLYKGTGGTPVKTLLEMAEDAGWSTGVVTTTRVTHATPAATYAHINDRDAEEDIAKQLVPAAVGFNKALGDGLEVIFGGGQTQFTKRADSRNLVEELKTVGYTYADSTSNFLTMSTDVKKAIALFTSSHMSYDLDRDPGKEPSLAQMSAKAVDILKKNPKGFFLMVEGGRIDHALHDTNARRALQDTVAFDYAIRVVIDQLKVDDPELKNTLIVVTADHDHTMVMNGYAKRTGPTNSGAPGILGLAKDAVSGANLKDLDGMPYSILGFGNGPNRVAGARSTATALTDTVTFDKDYHQESAIKMPAGGETHGGTDVFIGAIGLNADKVHGFLTNTEVFGIVKEAAGF